MPVWGTRPLSTVHKGMGTRLCLCTSATAFLASFPGSTPQLFITPCINGAIKSWGVESGNEATASPHEYVLGGLEDDVEGIPGEQQEQLHPLPSRLPHLTLGEGGGGRGREGGGGRRISPDRNTTQQLLQHFGIAYVAEGLLLSIKEAMINRCPYSAFLPARVHV